MRVITDPKEIAELEDRLRAQKAGVNYDDIASSRDAQIAKRQTGRVFARERANEGGKTEGFIQGLVGDPVEGITQAFMRGGNRVQRALGIDPNRSIENVARSAIGLDETKDAVRSQGVFSDRNVRYQDAQRKVREAAYQEGRAAQGRGGIDVSRIAGGVFSPAPAVGKNPLVRGATQGASSAAMQAVDVEPGESYLAKKAADTGLGAVAGGAVSAVGSRVARRLARKGNAPPTEFARAAQAARDLNVDAGIGQLTQYSPLSRATHVSANAVGGGRINKAAQRTEEQLGERLADIGQQIGGSTNKYQVGQAASRAVNRVGGFTDRFQNRADRLYSEVDNLAPPDVDAIGTALSMRRVQNLFQNNPALGERLGNTRLAGMASDIVRNPQNPGRLAFPEAQALRSEIGRMMGDSSLINDIPRADLSNVYRSLTEDMRDALASQPGQRGVDALRVFDRAGNYWKAGRARIDKLETILGDTGNDAEKIADRIAGMKRNDSRGLYQLRRSMEPQEWDDVASGLWHQLGQKSAGTADEIGGGFSPSQFLTNFNKVQQNPRAFNAMFGGTRYAAVQPQIRALATLSDRLKDNAKLANHSGTGYANSLLGLAGLTYANPAAGASAVGGNMAFAELMSNPRYLRWATGAGNALNATRRRSAPAIERISQRELAKLAALSAQGGEGSDAMAQALQAYMPQQDQKKQ